MITTYIDIQCEILSTTSTSYTPTTGAEGMVEIDPTKYDGNCEWYVAFSGRYSGGTPDNNVGSAQLYDSTNSVVVTGTADTLLPVSSYGVTAWKRITSYVASQGSAFVVYPQAKASGGATAELIKTTIMCVQRGFVTKTRHFWPMASNKGNSSTTHIEDNDPKRMTFTAGNYSGTITKYFHATISTTSSNGHIDFYDVTAGAQVSGSQIDTASTTPVYLKSGSISPTTGNEFTTQRWTDTTNTVNIENAFFVIDQVDTAGISKYETCIQVCARRVSRTGTTYGVTNSMIRFDAENFDKITYTAKCHYTRAGTLAGPTFAYDTTDDTVEIASSEATTTTQGYNTLLTGTITMPTGTGNILDNQLKASSLSAVLASGRVLIIVTAVQHEHTLPTLGVGG